MSKILNFSVVEILPALLSKAKTQTIRPAWEARPYMVNILAGVKNSKKEIFEKSSRFKVGDKVKLLWNQRSKYKDFTYCKKCDRIESFGIYHELARVCSICLSIGKHFTKHLGNAEITEVFKIEIGKDTRCEYFSILT
ncbi:MAG: hypothetical protein AABY22_27995, partial [Nanoarchaeota archaeon]